MSSSRKRGPHAAGQDIWQTIPAFAGITIAPRSAEGAPIPDNQALENVVDVVFLAHYLDNFVEKISDYGDDKLIDIVGMTLRKMSSHSHVAASALVPPPETTRIVLAAVEREKDTLAAMAAREQGG